MVDRRLRVPAQCAAQKYSRSAQGNKGTRTLLSPESLEWLLGRLQKWARRPDSKMLVRTWRGQPPARRAHEKAFVQQERFDRFFERVRFLLHRSSQCGNPGWSALSDQGREIPTVEVVQSEGVDTFELEGGVDKLNVHRLCLVHLG